MHPFPSAVKRFGPQEYFETDEGRRFLLIMISPQRFVAKTFR